MRKYFWILAALVVALAFASPALAGEEKGEVEIVNPHNVDGLAHSHTEGPVLVVLCEQCDKVRQAAAVGRFQQRLEERGLKGEVRMVTSLERLAYSSFFPVKKRDVRFWWWFRFKPDLNDPTVLLFKEAEVVDKDGEKTRIKRLVSKRNGGAPQGYYSFEVLWKSYQEFFTK